MSMTTCLMQSPAAWVDMTAPVAPGQHRSHFVNTRGPDTTSPNGVPEGYWCQRISCWEGTGALKDPNQLVSETIAALGDPPGAPGGPAVVMWDELTYSDGARLNSSFLVTNAAWLMGTNHGASHAYRWGCYLTNGPLVDYQAGIYPLNQLMASGGRIAVELYPHFRKVRDSEAPASDKYAGSQYSYCSASSTSVATRDEWLYQFIWGSENRDPVPNQPATYRLDWLMRYKAANYSGSPTIIHPIIGMSRRYLNAASSANNERFLDRIFHTLRRHADKGWIAIAERNDLGPGSWGLGVRGPMGLAFDYWDLWFRNAWDHYSYTMQTGPRLPAPGYEPPVG